MNESSFPVLALVALGSDNDTGPLEEAANMLIEVRDYLFYDVEAPDSPYDSKEPASPQNMVDLRGYLERVHRKLIAVIDFYGAREQDETSGRTGCRQARRLPAVVWPQAKAFARLGRRRGRHCSLLATPLALRKTSRRNGTDCATI